jgi:hypothetical protein
MVVLPREEDHTPVQPPLLMLHGFQRGLDQAPEVSNAAAFPSRLHNAHAVANRWQRAGEDLLGTRQVGCLDDAPFADPQEAIRAASGVRPAEHRVGLRLLMPHELYR